METNAPGIRRGPRPPFGVKTLPPEEPEEGVILAGTLRRGADLARRPCRRLPVMVSHSPPGILGPEGSGSLSPSVWNTSTASVMERAMNRANSNWRRFRGRLFVPEVVRDSSWGRDIVGAALREENSDDFGKIGWFRTGASGEALVCKTRWQKRPSEAFLEV